MVVIYVDIINRHFGRSFHQTNEFARNILRTNIMYLCRNLKFFGEKWEDEVVDHEMDL